MISRDWEEGAGGIELARQDEKMGDERWGGGKKTS